MAFAYGFFSLVGRFTWGYLVPLPVFIKDVLLVYLVYTIQILVARPTSTDLTRVAQDPFIFPAVAVCLTTLNSTKATAFLTMAPGGVRGLLNGTASGIACAAGIGSVDSEVPQDSTCGGRGVQWIDFPFSLLPSVCNIFNIDSLVTSNSPGATLSVVGRFPDFGESDLFSFSLSPQDDINIVPILGAAATKGGEIYPVLLFVIGV